LIKSIYNFFNNKENAEWFARNAGQAGLFIGKNIDSALKDVGGFFKRLFGGGRKGSSGPAPNMASNVNMNSYTPSGSNSFGQGGGNISPAQEAQIMAREHHSFFGANVVFNAPKSGDNVYNSSSFGTIHTSRGFYNDYLKNGLDSKGGMLIMHEYGHYLHAQYAPLNFYSYAMWSSIATSSSTAASSNWTEIRANTMAYYYFGQPNYKYWDPKLYPIDSNFLSTQEIYRLTRHLKPFNP